MLTRNLSNFDGPSPSWWQDLSFGAPTIASFAMLCSQALANPPEAVEDASELSSEAQVILNLARHRGTLDIRSKKDGFDSAERFLAVCVEVELDRWRLLLDKTLPKQTLLFLEAFGELCRNGLLLHHIQNEFSLSSNGFSIAESIEDDEEAIVDLSAFGVELDG